MKPNRFTLAIFLALVSTGITRSQETPADLLSDPTMDPSRPEDRAQLAARVGDLQSRRRENARAFATARGLPIRTVLPDGRIHELVDLEGEKPVYFTTHNANAAISTGANLLRTSPYTLSGTGIPIGLWDGGWARSTHQEYSGRVTLGDTSSIIDHATHVCGTLIASGVTASARGMADAATVYSYDWTNDVSEMTTRGAANATDVANGKIQVSNHSYGVITGWAYVNGGTPYRLWQWYGTTAGLTDPDFGAYNTTSSGMDSLAASEPYYLIFRSAGNDRGENPANGDSVYIGSSVVTYNSTVNPPGDGQYKSGFDTISYAATAKNVLTVGSVTDAVTSGARDVSKASVSYFSSWGPTDDGRIKPDVVANGDGLYSSLSATDSTYGTYSGTSMATPNACGSTALLLQQYKQLFPGQAMRAATIKDLLIHTADDIGNPGPDYKTGWGLVNVKAAADLLQDHASFPTKQRITENQISTSVTTRTVNFVWDGTSPIRATLCWTDPVGSTTTTGEDDRTARLKNNLNLKIIAPNSTEYLPYVMPFVGTWTQASMDTAATTGVNNTDNVEQVRIAAPPAAGTYQVVVSYSGTLTGTTQNYSLLLSGASDQLPPPPAPPANVVATPGNNSSSLTWSASVGAASYTVKRSTTSGGPYTTISNPTSTNYLDTGLTNGATYYYVVSATSSYGEGANSAEAQVIPSPAPSSTVVTSSPVSTGTYGSTVTFTATVTGTGSTATGTVTFHDGASTLGSATLNTSAQASLAVSNLALGGHSITATYAGDSFFGPSTSTATTYTVTQKPVTITGVTAATKVYDGTTAAVLSGGTVSGVVSGETVTVVPGTGVFTSPNAGSQSVTASGYAIGGTNASNYYLASQPAVANAIISPRPVVISGTRIYDGTTAVNASDLTVQNNLDGANLDLTGTAELSAKNTGTQTFSSGIQPARVRFATGSTGNSSSSSINVTMGAAPVTGNTMIAVITTRGGVSNIVNSITQTGATWTRAAQSVYAAGSVTTEVWYAPGVTNAGTGITISQSTVKSAAVIMEYSGLLVPASLDRTATASGNGTSVSTGTTTTTTQAKELWIGAIGTSSASTSVGSFTNGFTLVSSAQTSGSSNAKAHALEKFVSAAATATTGGTAGNTVSWAGVMATFKALMPGTLALTGSAAGNYTTSGMSGSVIISPKPLSVSGAAALDKVYDGNTVASLAAGASLATAETAGSGTTSDGKPYSGDDVALGGSPSATFDNRHAGVNKTVTATGYALTGTNSTNYTLTQPSGLTATIQPRATTVTAATCTKVYDGTTAAPGTPSINPAITEGDTVTSLSQSFQNPNAGIGNKEIIPSVSINDGNGGANYAITLVNDTTGTITPAPATITLGNLSPVYDGAAKTVTLVTDPPDLATSVTYNGSPEAPVNAGSYEVAATITDTNHQGSGSGTLVIEKAAANIDLSGLSQTYDGSPKSITATTTPGDLTITTTYDGSPTAPTNAGSYAVLVTADGPNHHGTTSGTLVIEKAAATIELASLTQTYDGSPKSVTATTTPGDLDVEITYNGSPDEPSDAGSYAVHVTADGPNHHGTASGTFVIGKALATIELGNLSQTYDGSPKAIAATTTPGDLTITATYDGSPDAPTNAGTYAVLITADGPNHHGTATGSLVIGKAAATIELTGLSQVYDGSPKPVTAIATPEGLTVTITYDGSATAPTADGSYAILATADGPNHHGTATGTLVIEPGNASVVWTQSHFTESEISQGLAADEADPDGDGLVNLAEYALGTDPRHFSPPLAAVRDENGLTLTFTRPAGLTGISYAAESSDGLGTWSPVTLEVIATGTTETVRARDPLTSGNPGRRFIRLRFERQ